MNLEENKVRDEELEGQVLQQVSDKPSLFVRLKTSIVSGTSKGVTLIELLAVIAILAVIAAVAIPVVENSINNSKISTTKQNLQILSSALQRYYAANNSYPQASKWIDASTGSVGSATLAQDLQPYIQGIPQDGWGEDFQYESTTSGSGSSSVSGFAIATPDSVAGTANSKKAYYVASGPNSTGSPQSGNAP
ncbi:type II secretion system protein GspG [Alicyclobacillus sp. SO9]|uniref:type II secretion system protein GspG n=1 Tax=Alicyclobacillus sp. SO9 TaxID=2665646 RepID=UPI0018E756D2|nr:type II secretion system protein GspG [Alicyclobacillus sp. SO9]QQE77545.1 type II secretion system protein GspG [Alicyclobacillus sp. SO9]